MASGAGGSAVPTMILILVILVLGAIVFLRFSGRIRRRTSYAFGAVAAVALVVIALAIYRSAP
jgi:hypothetical protein